MIPLVILDLDGTVIGASGKVEDCIWQAVDQAKQEGIKFAVCTGRPALGVAQKVAERLGPSHPHIFHNGAQIAYASGEGVKLQSLKESITQELVSYARKKSLVLELYTPTTLFVERKTPMSEAHAKMIGVSSIVRDLEDVSEREPIIRAQWIIPKTALNVVLECQPEGAKFSVATSPADDDSYFISITKTTVSKGEATHLLCEHLNVPLERTLAVGDSPGDMPMLERVGFPFVMANAEETLLEQFPILQASVDACGVVEAIEIARKTFVQDSSEEE